MLLVGLDGSDPTGPSYFLKLTEIPPPLLTSHPQFPSLISDPKTIRKSCVTEGTVIVPLNTKTDQKSEQSDHGSPTVMSSLAQAAKSGLLQWDDIS